MPRRPRVVYSDSDHSSSESDLDQLAPASSVGSDSSDSEGSVSIAATDGSNPHLSCEASNDSNSQSDASQTMSERSSSVYQTDVTISSSASEEESEALTDDDSQYSEDSEYSAPAEMSDADDPQYIGEDGTIRLSDDTDDSEDNDYHDDSIVIIEDRVVPAVAAAEVQIVQEAAAAPVQVAEPARDPEPGPSGQQTDENSSKTANGAKKRPASEMASDGDDDDEQMCMICYDNWEGTGPHRIVSLKCGHLFGQSCVEKWLKMHKKCPKCNTPNKVSDVRKIFAPVIKVKETDAENRLKAELDKALKEKRLMELQLLRKEQEMRSLQEAQARLEANATSSASAQSSTARGSTAAAQSSTARCSTLIRKSSNSHLDRRFHFKLTKDTKLPFGGGRVMAFCPWDNKLAVSCASPMDGYFGLKMLNCERSFMVQNIDSFHAQTIRDLAYCPNRDSNLLLTASLDKTAKMVDHRASCVVQTYRVPSPVWSCCWDTTGVSGGRVDKISLGMANGEVYRYDMRMASNAEPMLVLGKRTPGCAGQDITGVHSLVAIPAGASDSLPRGALLASHIKSCHIFSGDEDAFGAKLNIDGTFSCMRAEPVTGHILISNKQANHQVMRVRKGAGLAPDSVLEPVMPIEEFSQPQQNLARSAVSTYVDDRVTKLLVAGHDEISHTVKIWSVTEGGTCMGTLPLASNAMDICCLTFNHSTYFAFLTANKLSVYDMFIK
ncbi:E3 ubiquitin-protein ligase RFWD3-like [Cloeon dipterum]|uniref:E3 ubiquitin-protein ligase RFWD3-like n=1 Tax=Cloeon dipterum TaxID=197152 RepID=UPI0032207CD6